LPLIRVVVLFVLFSCRLKGSFLWSGVDSPSLLLLPFFFDRALNHMIYTISTNNCRSNWTLLITGHISPCQQPPTN
jgi:hypothetical protein